MLSPTASPARKPGFHARQLVKSGYVFGQKMKSGVIASVSQLPSRIKPGFARTIWLFGMIQMTIIAAFCVFALISHGREHRYQHRYYLRYHHDHHDDHLSSASSPTKRSNSSTIGDKNGDSTTISQENQNNRAAAAAAATAATASMASCTLHIIRQIRTDLVGDKNATFDRISLDLDLTELRKFGSFSNDSQIRQQQMEALLAIVAKRLDTFCRPLFEDGNIFAQVQNETTRHSKDIRPDRQDHHEQRNSYERPEPAIRNEDDNEDNKNDNEQQQDIYKVSWTGVAISMLRCELCVGVFIILVLELSLFHFTSKSGWYDKQD